MKKFVNFFTCFIFIILLSAGMSVSNIFASPSGSIIHPSFSAGPPDGYTGSPADGGNTCVQCHSDFVLNTGTLTVTITAPSTYTLGAVNDISVSFNNTNAGMAMFGFELMATDANDAPVGTLSISDDYTQVSGNYIKHTMEGHDHVGSDAGWSFQWTAPAAKVTDPVTFYAAGNECNGDGNTTGDYIYTASASATATRPGGDDDDDDDGGVDPSTDIDANNSDGPVTISPEGDLSITVSLDPGSADGQNADWWAYATSPSGNYTYDLNLGWISSNAPIIVYGGPLFSVSSYELLPFTSRDVGDYVFTFSVDGNMDGVQDDTYTDSVTVTIASDAVSFKNDVLPLFSATDGKGAWFDYGNSDIGGGWEGPATACGTCHAGDDGDGEEVCPPECHTLDLNTHAGWLAGMDDGMMTLLGESSVGATDYNWGMSMLKMRLRNNRMPPGMPFMIDEGNRDGGDVDTSDDGNDISLGGQFYVNVAGTSGYGEVEYGGTYSAVGLLEAYVSGLSGSLTTYAGSTTSVVWADVAGLFSEANVWYNGGLACTACHYCDEEPPCFHEIDFSSEEGLLAGADGGMMTLLGESSVGATDYNWGSSMLRMRVRNSRMPPNSPFDVNELTRDGQMLTHPLTGAEVRAVDLVGEWVIGADGIAGTADDALDN